MQYRIDFIRLGEDLFTNDRDNRRLNLVGAPDTFIRFRDMDLVAGKTGGITHRRILYDTEAKQKYQADPDKPVLPAKAKLLEIPYEIFLAPGGIKEPSLPENIRLDLRDYLKDGIYQAREIPRRMVHGTEFFVDSMMLQLRQVNDTSNKISFEDISMTRERLFFDYNRDYKNIPRPEDRGSHANTVAYLPLLKEIDPLIWARIEKSEVAIDKTLSPTTATVKRQPRKLKDPPGPRLTKGK